MKYRIPEENIAVLYAAIEALAKTARKLGLAEPVLSEIGTEFEQLEDGTVRRWSLQELTGDAPIVAGWTFAAVIQFVTDDDGVEMPLFRSVPGEQIPSHLRQLHQRCDHCQLVRNRRDTYLVRNADSSEWLQIGSSCLRDFTGHADPHALARYAENLAEFGSLAEIAQSPGDGVGRSYVEISAWLAGCARSIREDGWMSGHRAWELGSISTRERVEDNLHAPAYRRWRPTLVDEGVAAATLAWVRGELANQAELTDYEYNLVVACRPTYVERRVLGIVTSAIVTWQRAVSREAERQAAAKESAWQGSVGEVWQGTAVVSSYSTTDGMYGVTHVVKLRDPSGNRFTWFASRLPATDGATWAPEVGKAVDISGRVKAHSEWKGVKETILTRCKVKWQ